MDRPYIVVACDDGDVRIYDDMSDIGRDLESIDIRTGNYRCYDVSGRELSFHLDREQLVALEEKERTPSHQEDLRQALLYYLAAIGQTFSDHESISIPELVRLARISGADAPPRGCLWFMALIGLVVFPLAVREGLQTAGDILGAPLGW